MSEPRDREESGSVGLEDSGDESQVDRGSRPPAAKPGRKKSANSQAARRDQNRIAQREFRLRKQQRIRDLEARVEILSGGKDEALSEIRNILKDLMEENQQLRNLLRSVGAFIGEGAGGLLQRIGWTLADFNNYINKSETDTAWESYQRRKKNPASDNTDTTTSLNHQTQKRPLDEDTINTSHSKKSRGHGNHDGEREGSQDRYSLTMPINSSTHLGMYPPSSGRPSHDGLFPDLMKGTATSPIFARSPTATTSGSSQYGGAPSATNVSTYPPSYVPPINVNHGPAMLYSPSNPHGSTQQQRLAQLNQQQEAVGDDDDDPNKNEAYKLISYHLDNYHRNSSYHLPASLRPTLVQKTITHETIIDKILHPDLRDRMILLRGRFDLADCLLDYRSSVTLHGDDVLVHTNWEIDERWLRKYHFLVDHSTINIANRWRRERGDPELRLADLSSSDIPPGNAP